jgi:hypothetical protein
MTVEGQNDHVCHVRSIRTVINYCIFKYQVLETKKKKTLEYNILSRLSSVVRRSQEEIHGI